MSALAEITRDIQSLESSAEAYAAATSDAERTQLLARIRDQLEKLQELDERIRSGGAGDQGAVPAATALRENETATAETLRSCALSLQRYLTGTLPSVDPDSHQLLQKAVNVAIGYAAGYQDLRDRSIAHEAAAFPAPKEGEVDQAGLTRDIIRRFPNILKTLAE
jgi:hypothetical protein